MKLGQPTTELPGAKKSQRGKYDKIYKMVRQLKPHEWLPVQFETEHDAYNFRVAASTLRALPIEARLRGSAVYVRLRPETKNGGKSKEKK